MYSERTLMISGSEKGLDSVTSFLKACGCGSVAVISSGSEARRMIPHDDFDLILINTPLKDEFGHQLAVKLCESTCSGVILICKADLAEEMTNRTSDYGVCVVPKPLNKQELLQAIRMGSAFRHRCFLGTVRTRERASDVSEESRRRKFFGERTAVHSHKRLSCPLALVV